jgi:hypothetical protein
MQHLQQKKKSNESFQDITQESSTAESFSNNNMLASCNNVVLPLTLNDGSNSAGQQ